MSKSRREQALADLASIDREVEPVPVRRALTPDPAVQVAAAPVEKAPTRRQTVDFEIPEHNRLKQLALNHNTNVAHLIRVVMRSVDDSTVARMLTED